MRVVVCDEDVLMCDVIEAVVANAGHEIAGVASSTAAGVNLVEVGRPDAVILDVSFGYNTDFDVIGSAIAVGAHPIVFSRQADADLSARYSVAPTVVSKPDLVALELALDRLAHAQAPDGAVGERRLRPSRAAAGPCPTGVADAQAFFEALNDARGGDAIVSIDMTDAASVAIAVSKLLRDTGRLLAMPNAVRLFLPAAGEEGVQSVLARISDSGLLTPACTVCSVVVDDGEDGAAAFDRLKHGG